jgi:hypothetical protein
MTEFDLVGTASARLRKTTIKGLKAMRNPEIDETIDDVVQRLIRFYLKKPAESKRKIRRQVD